ncbi:MAG: pyridoxal phosphate-dependent decarboxylase family protein [Actinomycetota bacterium]
MLPMHEYTEETERLARAIEAYARDRIAEPQPLDRTLPAAELDVLAGETISPEGIGWEATLRIWADVLAPATVSTDHPSSFAFIPGAPTRASALFDLIVGASSTIAAGWIDGAGAVWAENQALRWVADLAGLPDGAGGVFVSGGSAGNLSSLVTARHTAAERRGGRPDRWRIVACDTAHSSVTAAARVMDVDVLPVPHDARERLTRGALETTLDADGGDGVFAVVASAGSTNAGTVDDLAGIAEVCSDRGLWFHVDGAYGGAGLLAPSARPLFDGIERADSFIVDPHKWLFSPYDACALLYRDPTLALAAHRQVASYLDTALTAPDWNPADYAYHLTRRARGLPLWFSLATHGTDAYREAVEKVLTITRRTAAAIADRPDLELLMEPDLSVLLFRRIGWGAEDYDTCWRRLLQEQIAFVQPTSWEGEKVMRLCFINPRTTMDHVRPVLDAMTRAPG